MTTASERQEEIKEEWKRLGRASKRLDELRSFIKKRCIPAAIDVTGGVVVVTLIDKNDNDARVFDSFTMPLEAEPRPSQAKREIDGRQQATQSLIQGIVDSLELRYRADQAAEELRAFSGGESGPAGLFYDLVDLGSRTLRELLHLNARANRRLLTALQSLGPATPSVTVIRAGDGAVLRLAKDKAATLTLENQLTDELTVTIPKTLAVCRSDGTGGSHVVLDVKPEKVVLPRGARCEIEVKLASDPETPEHDLLGELVLSGSDSTTAIVAVVVPRGAPGDT